MKAELSKISRIFPQKTRTFSSCYVLIDFWNHLRNFGRYRNVSRNKDTFFLLHPSTLYGLRVSILVIDFEEDHSKSLSSSRWVINYTDFWLIIHI